MNHNKNSFYCSNLGKFIEKERSITSVILLNVYDKNCMSLDYKLYYCRDGKIDRDESNDLEVSCYGDDKYFPQYLCSKGAVIIGNIVEDANILEKF